jgi:uncharacterized protein YaaR (DUF327 family)
MLPSLGALRISTTTDGSFDRHSNTNIDTKRVFDEFMGIVNKTSLDYLGRFPEKYTLLVINIVKNLPQLSGGTKQKDLDYYALEQLNALLKRSDPSKVFKPSKEGRYASISPEPVTEKMASQIALAFFKSKAEAPANVLSADEKETEKNAQKVVDMLRKKQDKLSFEEEQEMEKKLFKLELLYDNSETIEQLFVKEHKNLVVEFASKAIDSFLSLQDSKSRPLLNADVDIVLQSVDANSYNPIAEAIHMDPEVDMAKSRGSRYGRPAAEQDIQSLITSFCADLVGPDEVALSACSTVYFDNVPIVEPELLVEAALEIKSKQGMGIYTEYEIISSMGDKLANATRYALSDHSEEDLRMMGIVAKKTNMLEWTNANALAFHRSARRDEVLAGAVSMLDGRLVAPRMRAFAHVFTDTNPHAPKLTETTIELPNITHMSREIKARAYVYVMWGGQRAGMGEDVMP